MKDKKRLAKSNQIIGKLRAGGFENLKPAEQLVYADYRITKRNYWHKTGHNPSTVSNFISGYNVGALKEGHPLFNRTFEPYVHLALDEVNKYYNSRLSIDFPDEVATFWQTAGHNNISATMVSQRGADVDAKIREILDTYIDIQFMWVFKIPFTKIVFLTLWRCYQWHNYDDYIAKKRPLFLLERIARWFLMLPSASSRKVYLKFGNIFNHYDSTYHRPLYYRANSRFEYQAPPFHYYNLEQYNDYLARVQSIRPLAFERQTKRERKKQAEQQNKK